MPHVSVFCAPHLVFHVPHLCSPPPTSAAQSFLGRNANGDVYEERPEVCTIMKLFGEEAGIEASNSETTAFPEICDECGKV